jgi:hypothetical protein
MGVAATAVLMLLSAMMLVRESEGLRSLHKSPVIRPSTHFAHLSGRDKRQQLIRQNLVDPETTKNVIEAYEPSGLAAFTQSFWDTFVRRVEGGILGNIVAGFAVKWFFDNVVNGFTGDSKQSKTKGSAAMSVNADATAAGQQQRSNEKAITSQAWLKLVACLMIDGLGDTSFLLPGVGEVEDTIWAPISTYLILQLFDNKAAAGLDFAKEILPFTDIIPVATFLWLFENVLDDTAIGRMLDLKKTKQNKT